MTATHIFAQAIADMNAVVVPMLANVQASIDGNPVTGIFENPYARSDVTSYGVAASQPALTVRSADIAVAPVGLVCVVDETTYVVEAAEPDGTGLTRLLLGAQA